MHRHRARLKRALAAGALAPLLWATLAAPAGAATEASTPVIYLDQGWSAAERAWYYQTSQGSAVMSYDIFLNLEQAGSQQLFRSDKHSDRFGLIPQASDPRTNPDGLPVGLSKTVIPKGPWRGEMIGLNCAACHNGQLHYQGKRVRIDGGVGTTFDMMGYVQSLDDAVQETLHDQQKFDRLAARLGVMSIEAKRELGQRLEREAQPIRTYRTRTLATPTEWGPGRIDAIGAIVNRLTATETGIPENWSTPLAPTKPPFLWNSPQGSWTQWRAVQQDPIRRNLTEVMGVFMPLDLHSKSPEDGLFESAAVIGDLGRFESQLRRLAPPKWPEEVFGKIDRQKAAAGKALFADNCAACHNAYPYTWTEPNKFGKRFLEVGLVPGKYVGTDPGQFRNLRPYAVTGGLAPYLPGDLKDKKIVPTGELYAAIQKRVLDAALSSLTLTEAQASDLHGYREFPLEKPRAGYYKAAPREGVWATPPFLHNGSVPSLYELLLPAGQRTRKFYVGREFDPVKVGLDTSGKSGSFVLDTSLPGNSNAGHSFENGPLGNGVIGRLLTDKERWELVEYLKSIPEAAGQVTPFGGPPNATKGTSPWTKY